MDGQHDIWKIRNQVKHGTSEDGKMARETIEMLIEERAQYKIDTPMTATDVAKWTKAKQNKWKNKTEDKIAKAKKQKRESEGYKKHGYHTDLHLNKEQHEKIITTEERREIQQHRKQNRIKTTPTINKTQKQDHKRTI